MLGVLREVVEKHSTFGRLYTDRAAHFVYTPKAGEGPDHTNKTRVERVLDELGIELVCGDSPQARGRSERMWRTLQGRLPNELGRLGVNTYDAANADLRGRCPFNKLFTVADPALEAASPNQKSGHMPCRSNRTLPSVSNGMLLRVPARSGRRRDHGSPTHWKTHEEARAMPLGQVNPHVAPVRSRYRGPVPVARLPSVATPPRPHVVPQRVCPSPISTRAMQALRGASRPLRSPT